MMLRDIRLSKKAQQEAMEDAVLVKRIRRGMLEEAYHRSIEGKLGVANDVLFLLLVFIGGAVLLEATKGSSVLVTIGLLILAVLALMLSCLWFWRCLCGEKRGSIAVLAVACMYAFLGGWLLNIFLP